MSPVFLVLCEWEVEHIEQSHELVEVDLVIAISVEEREDVRRFDRLVRVVARCAQQLLLELGLIGLGEVDAAAVSLRLARA